MAAEKGMDKASKARLIAVDFAASVLLALSIGLATSVALGTAVLLIAHQSASPEAPAGVSVAQDPS